MNLTEEKAAALSEYKAAKKAYEEALSKSDFRTEGIKAETRKFAEAKRQCMLLGVRI